MNKLFNIAKIYMKTYHMLIKGRVQGVGFRVNTRRQARKLGLTGWVRNLANGDVKVVAEGEQSDLKQLVSWAQTGPSMAHVNDVKENWKESNDEFSTFSIKY